MGHPAGPAANGPTWSLLTTTTKTPISRTTTRKTCTPKHVSVAAVPEPHDRGVLEWCSCGWNKVSSTAESLWKIGDFGYSTDNRNDGNWISNRLRNDGRHHGITYYWFDSGFSSMLLGSIKAQVTGAEEADFPTGAKVEASDDALWNIWLLYRPICW